MKSIWSLFTRGLHWMVIYFFLVWVLTANCRRLYKTCNIFFCNPEVWGMFILSAVEQSFFCNVSRQQKRQSLSFPPGVLSTFSPPSFISPSLPLSPPRPAVFNWGLTFIGASLSLLGRCGTRGRRSQRLSSLAENQPFLKTFLRSSSSLRLTVWTHTGIWLKRKGTDARLEELQASRRRCRHVRFLSAGCSSRPLTPPHPPRIFLSCVTEILWPVKEKTYFLSLWSEPLMHYMWNMDRWRENSLSSILSSNTETILYIFYSSPFLNSHRSHAANRESFQFVQC